MMKPHLGTLIVLNTSQPSTADYARISMTAESTCAFLDSDRLCGVQKKLGAEALSVTCNTYPRAISQVAGEVEEALNLSCPEAARLTLLEPRIGDWGAGRLDPYAAFRQGAGGQPQLAIREFALELLSDRRYALWQRMYLLGILARRLQALSFGAPVAAWADENPRTVARLLADSARVATVGTLRGTMDEAPARPAEQLLIVMELLRTRLSQHPRPQRFMECVQDFEAGLGCATATCEQDILNAYAASYERYYLPFMQRHPHILENWLANSVFKNAYPFGRKSDEGADPESEHMVLTVQLALIQTLLVGLAGRYREAFGSEHVVKLVQSFGRTFEHSREAVEQIKELVRARNVGNSRGIALLLRLE
jgi:lysine-N-methylase